MALTVNLSVSTAQATGYGTDIIRNVEDVSGSSAGDAITGSSSANVLDGNAGNDTIRGQAGADTIYGDAGNDTLYGGTGSDTLYGGDNGDVIFGQDGNDTARGGSGSDTLEALLEMIPCTEMPVLTFFMARTVPTSFTVEMATIAYLVDQQAIPYGGQQRGPALRRHG